MEKTPGTADAAVVGKTHTRYRTRKSGRVEGKRGNGDRGTGGRAPSPSDNRQTHRVCVFCVYIFMIAQASVAFFSGLCARDYVTEESFASLQYVRILLLHNCALNEPLWRYKINVIRKSCA